MTDLNKQECRDKPSAGFSVTVRLEIENRPGGFARITQQLANAGASLAEVTLISSDFDHTVRDVTIACKSDEHSAGIIELLKGMERIQLISWQDDTLEMHRGGKLTVDSKAILKTTDELSRAYTPGVARVCDLIHRDPDSAYNYTIKGNCVAVVTDGSAVLGLGNIGSMAALPVMEGKAMLFKQFAGVEAFPICIESQDTEEIISVVKNISGVFGGINLEDISSPRCFEIERRLQEDLDIPIFHDDQHGTAVVVLAGLLNALKIVGKKLEDITVAVNGFGASGVACTKLMMLAGVRNVIACDTTGIIYKGRSENMNSVKQELAEVTNIEGKKGILTDAVRGADVFLGVSKPGMLTPPMVQSMAKDPIVFALANPVPEILPGEVQGLARIIATGRSDYANQVNNVLCFPGIFKGALECRARKITSGMKIAAAYAISECVGPSDLREDYIIPNIFKVDVASRVAERVKEVAVQENLHRVPV
ncbi:MAG: NAD-dependent malic enzyme [Deltaproteobacteria bacterium]|nr:NAD-dependent malic enzyme [Deltaproteobacteria bacterium]